MITLNDIRQVVHSYIPFDTGYMFLHANRFSEDATKFTIIYDCNVVPYIVDQEYGFIHYKSKKKIMKNYHFIQDDTVNALNFLVNGATATEKSVILASAKKTTQTKASQVSQGVLQSLQGNKTR